MKNTLGTAAFAVLCAISVAQPLHAQTPASAPAGHAAGASRHAAALSMELRGDDKGAFVAYLAAAESGYPPAQRRLGEIYDSGNSVVKRNYEESIRWYQKAREGGEVIPPPKTYGSPFISPLQR